MIRYNTYAYVINHVNLALSKRNGRNELILTRKTLTLMTALRSAGCVDKMLLLRRFNRRTRKFEKVIRFSILLYKGLPFFKGVRLLSTPTKRHTISIKALQIVSISLGNSFLILSTSRGLVSHSEALKMGIGGLLLCAVS